MTQQGRESVDFRSVDLNGLSPIQAIALGAFTADLLAGAEERGFARGEASGYRKAIQALRDEAADFIYESGRDHPFRYAADYLENIAAAREVPDESEEGKLSDQLKPCNAEQCDRCTWYVRRVTALEDLLSHYRIGRTPGERLLTELDETRKHVGSRGEWAP